MNRLQLVCEKSRKWRNKAEHRIKVSHFSQYKVDLNKNLTHSLTYSS